MSFVQFTETTNGQELYGYEGNGKYEFTTSLPSDPALISFIGLALMNLVREKNLVRLSRYRSIPEQAILYKTEQK